MAVRRFELDAPTLKALAHPLRLEILRLLELHGSVNVTGLAAELGETTGAVSYHLRQLARHGLVEEGGPEERAADAPEGQRPPVGRRRRLWRMAVDEIHMTGTAFLEDEDTREAAGFVLREFQSGRSRRLAHWLATVTTWPAEWERASSDLDATLTLDPVQARALADELKVLVDRYRELPRTEGARRVEVQYTVFPSDLGGQAVTGLGPRFWRMYASSATSNLADGICRTVLPLLAASYTRDPVLVAGLTTFAFLPWLLFAMVSGALVDRVDRRHAMSAANAVRALSLGGLAVVTALGAGSVAALYVVAFLLGMAETVYDSATRALLPQVVSRPDLDRANSLLTVEESLGQQFLGSPLGSVLFAVAATLTLGLDAAGFAVAALLVLAVRGVPRPVRPATATSVRADVAEGVRWLARHRFLRALTTVSALTCLTNSMINGVLVLYVLDVLQVPEARYGLFVLAGGIGALLGGVLTPALARLVGRGAALTGGAVLSAVATGALGLVRDGVVAAALFAVSAAGVMVWNVLTMSLRQSLIPQHLFGRVQGAYRTLVWGAIPLGSLLGGAVAYRWGIPAVFRSAGVGELVLAVVLGLLLRRHAAVLRDDDVDDAAIPVLTG